jgi:hypothetical protein
VVGGVFLALGLFFLWRHPNRTPWFAWPGGVLIVAGALLPRVLRWLYIGWMSFAFILGFVMAHIILTLFYYGVITPVGVLARLVGKDFLALKLDRGAATYWRPRKPKEHKPQDYERQF